MNTFALMYPLSVALGIPVVDAGPGFDVLELEAKLGPERFGKLISTLPRRERGRDKVTKQIIEHSVMFVCGHAYYPDGHEFSGNEVHCVYAADLEAFLKAGG